MLEHRAGPRDPPTIERNPDLPYPSCRAGCWPDHHSRRHHHRAGRGRRNTCRGHHPLAVKPTVLNPHGFPLLQTLRPARLPRCGTAGSDQAGIPALTSVPDWQRSPVVTEMGDFSSGHLCGVRSRRRGVSCLLGHAHRLEDRLGQISNSPEHLQRLLRMRQVQLVKHVDLPMPSQRVSPIFSAPLEGLHTGRIHNCSQWRQRCCPLQARRRT